MRIRTYGGILCRPCDRHEVRREGADRAEARQALDAREPVEAAAPEVALPVHRPRRRVLVVVPDVKMPDRDLDRLSDRHLHDLEAARLEHLPQRFAGVVDDVLVRVPDAARGALAHRRERALLEEGPRAVRDFDVEEGQPRLGDVFEEVAERDDVEALLLARRQLIEEAVVALHALPLGCDLRQRRRRIDADRGPVAPLDVAQEHADVAADVEEAPARLEARDGVELLSVVRIAVVRLLPFEDEPRLLEVFVDVAPVDLLGRVQPRRDVHERTVAAAADADRAVLLVKLLAIGAAAERTRNDDDVVGLVVVFLGSAALVVGRFLDQGHEGILCGSRRRTKISPCPLLPRTLWMKLSGRTPLS